MRRALLASAVAGSLVCPSSPASANGRFPMSNQIVFSPTDKNLVVLRTSYGLLPSNDHGATWGFICETALGLNPAMTEDPSIGLTTNNSLLVGLSKGLDVSTDVGCNWTCKENDIAGQVVIDLAVRPDNPAAAVLLTRSYFMNDTGPGGMLNQVYETTDNGVTWTPVGYPIDPTFSVQTIDVAKGDPKRLYVSGAHKFVFPPTASLYVSTDKGATWTEKVLPHAQYDPATEDSIYIGAVDPSDIERVYVRSNGQVTGGRSRLTVVTNASTTPSFTTAENFEVEAAYSGELVGELLGFALSPDGQKVYVGSQEDGLWVASASDLRFTKKSSISVQCLATRDDELWACAPQVSGFVVGMSTDDGANFTKKMHYIASATGPIACTANPSGAACNAQTNTSNCEPEYQAACATSLEPCGPDPVGKQTCGVSFVGIRPYGMAAAGGGLLALLAAAVRRRRRPTPSR